MKYAKIQKVGQHIAATPDGAVRIQRLKVRGVGHLVLNDGTTILITVHDIGRTIEREVNIQTKEDKVTFL